MMVEKVHIDVVSGAFYSQPNEKTTTFVNQELVDALFDLLPNKQKFVKRVNCRPNFCFSWKTRSGRY